MVVVKERDEKSSSYYLYDVNYPANSKLEAWKIFDPSKNQRIQERKICHQDQVARDRNRIDEVLVPLVIHLEMGIFNFRLELEDFHLGLLVLLEIKAQTHLVLVNLKLR